MKCVEMGWMTIMVGPTASAKTSLVRLLALLTGHRLRVMAMNSAMDTTELLGGFEQVTDKPEGLVRRVLTSPCSVSHHLLVFPLYRWTS